MSSTFLFFFNELQQYSPWGSHKSRIPWFGEDEETSFGPIWTFWLPDPIPPPLALGLGLRLSRGGDAHYSRSCRGGSTPHGLGPATPRDRGFDSAAVGKGRLRRDGGDAAIHGSHSNPRSRVVAVHLLGGKTGFRAGGLARAGPRPTGPALAGPQGPWGTALAGGPVGADQRRIQVTNPVLDEDLLKPQHESGRGASGARGGIAPVGLHQEAGERA